MSDLQCPVCKTIVNGPGDLFCYRDGTRLVGRPVCRCGHALHPADVFCPKCGTRVER